MFKRPCVLIVVASHYIDLWWLVSFYGECTAVISLDFVMQVFTHERCMNPTLKNRLVEFFGNDTVDTDSQFSWVYHVPFWEQCRLRRKIFALLTYNHVWAKYHQGQVRCAAHSKNATCGTNGDCWQGVSTALFVFSYVYWTRWVLGLKEPSASVAFFGVKLYNSLVGNLAST